MRWGKKSILDKRGEEGKEDGGAEGKEDETKDGSSSREQETKDGSGGDDEEGVGGEDDEEGKEAEEKPVIPNLRGRGPERAATIEVVEQSSACKYMRCTVVMVMVMVVV